MKSIGLQPSNSGLVGGKETGVQMSQYIVAGGAFDESYQQLRATGWQLHWESTPSQGASPAPKSKLNFTCSQCGQNVWGKPDTLVDCGHCGIRMALNEEKTDRTLGPGVKLESGRSV
jgi:hypothetical protein